MSDVPGRVFRVGEYSPNAAEKGSAAAELVTASVQYAELILQQTAEVDPREVMGLWVNAGRRIRALANRLSAKEGDAVS